MRLVIGLRCNSLLLYFGHSVRQDRSYFCLIATVSCDRYGQLHLKTDRELQLWTETGEDTQQTLLLRMDITILRRF